MLEFANCQWKNSFGDDRLAGAMERVKKREGSIILEGAGDKLKKKKNRYLIKKAAGSDSRRSRA